MYFDEAGSVTAVTTATAYQAVTGWLLLLDPSQAAGVNSWECEIRTFTNGPDPIVNWEVLGTSVVVSPPPRFQVGMGIPHPWAPVIALARASIFVPLPGQSISFQILPFDPPSLSDPPGYPVYQPVYGSGSAVDLFPLDVPGSCFSTPVARINHDAPFAPPTLRGIPDTLHFGNVDPGSAAWLNFDLTNPGDTDLIGTLTLNMPETTYAQGDEYYTSEPTSFRIIAGRELNVRLLYQPETSGPKYGTLTIAYCGRTETIDLMGGLDINCSVLPLAIDFGTVGLPTEGVARTATVSNRGDIPMDATPRFLEECPEFTWEPYGASAALDPADLQPWGAYTVLVTYAPTVESYDTCTLVFGDGDCGAVALAGRGMYLPPSCRRYPDSLGFGVMVADSTQVKSFFVTNTGGGILAGEVSLDDATGAFSLLTGVGPFALENGDTVTVDVQFAPQVEQAYSAMVNLGTACGGVALTGECAEPVIDYYVTPTSLLLDWGVRPFGEVGNVKYVNAFNRGTATVSGDLQISGPPGFRVLSATGPFTMIPGTGHLWAVEWDPTVYGEETAVISTGLPGGEMVTCRGFGVETLPGAVNKLGFYFDRGFLTTNIMADLGTEVTGYLVIKDPTAPIGGWEMQLSIDGTAEFLDWTLGGGATGDLGPEVFRVQLAEPRPAGTTAVLGSVRILVPYRLESTIQEVHPPDPVIPGFASFIDADDPGNHLPLGLYQYPKVLATINWSPVGVEAPSMPGVRATGGEVALDWSCGNDPAEEYHVYRRLGDQEFARLTAVPVGCTDGFGSFLDRPEAVPGTVVSYAISAMREGQESPLSVAAEVTLTAGIPSRTRLLASYPNPFNPQTTVPFVMGEPGHARLAVYDLAGRLVAVLLDQDLPAGQQERAWSGLDSRGRPVPSGVYYLRLDAGGRVDMGKTMLLK